MLQSSNMNENHRYLYQAFLMAQKSTDLSTQNGAVIVNKNGIVIGEGANMFPRGVKETPQRLIRPTKYRYVVHAETNSIYDAARKGNSTEGATMYSPWAACEECAKAIIQSGIIKVIAHQESMNKRHDNWAESIRIALEMFKEAKVEYILFSAKFDGIKVLFDGQIWEP